MDYSYLAPPLAAHQIQHTDYYIKHNEKEKGARKIYETVAYDSFEQEKIKELKQEIAKLNIILPNDWKESDYLKIGYSGRFKMKEVIKKLQLHISWRANPIYHQINPATEKFLKEGICYVFGRDKQYRPIVILNAHLIDLKKYDKETIIQALSFQMGIIKNYMFIPGKVENWMFLLESNGLGVMGLPVKALQVVIDTMSTNFGGCLEKMFILNPSGTLNFLWKTISGFLDPETAQKINFLQQKEFKKIQEFIDPSQLEMKYGGIQNNQIKFWPPYNLDLFDGYTIPKQQKQEPNQMQDFNQKVEQNNKAEDPYDKVDGNVNDFFESQKKFYAFEDANNRKSAEFGYKPENPDEVEQHQKSQENEPSVKQKLQQQQQIQENQEEEKEKDSELKLDTQQQQEMKTETKHQEDHQPQIVQEPEAEKEPEIIPSQQVDGKSQQEMLNEQGLQGDLENKQEEKQETQQQKQQIEQEEAHLSNASVTKQQPEEVQGQNVEITKVDPVANNAACCRSCVIF